jgi:adenylosuccinate lyase
LHERIRRHAQAAARQVKQHGRPNDLIERLQGDPAFGRVKWARVLEARRYVGLAPQQTREFLAHTVQPLLKRHRARATRAAELRV